MQKIRLTIGNFCCPVFLSCNFDPILRELVRCSLMLFYELNRFIGRWFA